jgi:hypothetical protein
MLVHISQVNTQTTHIKSIEHNGIATIPVKPWILAGFEPGSSDPEADAMSSAPRRQGVYEYPFRPTIFPINFRPQILG